MGAPPPPRHTRPVGQSASATQTCWGMPGPAAQLLSHAVWSLPPAVTPCLKQHTIGAMQFAGPLHVKLSLF
jgi:hypothetical protein